MNKDYWTKRVEQENLNSQRRTIAQTEKELRKIYAKESEQLYNDLLNTLSKIADDAEGGKVYANDLYRTQRFYELIEDFNKRAKAIGGKQLKLTKKALIDAYNNAKRIVGAEAPKSLLQPQFLVPSAIDTEQIVTQVWCLDGKNFSDRIWLSKQRLVQDLSQSLSDLVARGKTPYYIAQGVAARLGVDEYAAYRLVRTETAHAQIEGQIDKYKEMGFTKGKFVATDPCDDCAALNGQIFTLDELRTMLPRHPNCECSFLLEI